MKKIIFAMVIMLCLAFSIPQNVKASTTYNVPPNSGWKTYMDYRSITNHKSPQYMMVNVTTVDPKSGIRIYDGNDSVRYSVAVGTGFNAPVGAKIDVYLDNGKVIPCIVGDIKADIHTDDTNMLGGHGDVIEFIVDSKVMDKTAKKMGDCSYIPGLKGKVVKVEVFEIPG